MKMSGYILDLAALLPFNRRLGEPWSQSRFGRDKCHFPASNGPTIPLLSSLSATISWLFFYLSHKEVSFDIILVLNCIS
jgi:hypothetical protein